QQGEAEAQAGLGVPGVGLNGLAEGGEGAGLVPLVLQGEAELVVGPGEFGGEGDGPAVGGDGARQGRLLPGRQGVAAVAGGPGEKAARAPAVSPLASRAMPRST